MAVTRKDARKTRRITRSVAAANAGKPSDIPSNHIEPAPSTGKKACSATSNVTEKEGIISTGAKQMVTRSMANSNTPRVTWSYTIFQQSQNFGPRKHSKEEEDCHPYKHQSHKVCTQKGGQSRRRCQKDLGKAVAVRRKLLRHLFQDASQFALLDDRLGPPSTSSLSSHPPPAPCPRAPLPCQPPSKISASPTTTCPTTLPLCTTARAKPCLRSPAALSNLHPRPTRRLPARRPCSSTWCESMIALMRLSIVNSCELQPTPPSDGRSSRETSRSRSSDCPSPSRRVVFRTTMRCLSIPSNTAFGRRKCCTT
jgi:hypothetical protein